MYPRPPKTGDRSALVRLACNADELRRSAISQGARVNYYISRDGLTVQWGPSNI